MYKSTRGSDCRTGLEAIMQGLAKDGGLFVPTFIPKLSIKSVLNDEYSQLAVRILTAYLPDIPEETLKVMVKAAISTFPGSKITPVIKVGESYFLELFHGPTKAFKDIALSLLPHLYQFGEQKTKQKRVILVATSGDTGSATLAGFSQIPHASVIVFYPYQGISPYQEHQMLSYSSQNMHSIAIQGNFDVCQSLVKQLFSTYPMLTSANSINIGRLLPQITYYFYAYKELVNNNHIKLGEAINFSVPTGNFGNILAGYLARRMGCPIHRLLCCSNQNNVLTDFFRTGIYNRNRPFYTTNSPSMDIVVSSNLERLLWWIGGEDEVNRCMKLLDETGTYTINPHHQSAYQLFYGGFATVEETNATIQAVYKTNHYMMDPHTAVAYKVMNDYRKETHDQHLTVVVSTASYEKFMDTMGPLFPGLPSSGDWNQDNEAQRTVWSQEEVQGRFQLLIKEMIK
ncbi:MAG: threonine synthase [Bacilli bacterium]